MRVDVPTLLRPSRVVGAVFLAGLLVVACASGDTPATPVGPVEIVVHLDDLEHWEANGPLVDSNEFCPSGRRHLLAVFDPDTGEKISWEKFLLMFDDLVSPVSSLCSFVELGESHLTRSEGMSTVAGKPQSLPESRLVFER